MTYTPPSKDPIEALGEAYERLLDKAIEEVHDAGEKSGPALHKAIDKISEKSSEFTELAREEAEKVAGYLKRDLVDAAHYIQETGEGLKNWIGFDLNLIEDRLLEAFQKAADQTTLELLALKEQAAAAEYRTGEMIGLGILICDKCGEILHFHKPGHIPPCPKCKGSKFHREGYAK